MNQKYLLNHEEEFLGNLHLFFLNDPQSKFAIKSLADKFGCNPNYIHDCLLKLENQKRLIRCKIEIGGKPVTHWQINEYNNQFNSLKKFQYEPTNSMQIEFDQSSDDSSTRRVLLKSQENYPNSFQKKFHDVDRIEFDSPRITPMPRTFIKAKKSTTLNVNSPEFKPQHSLSNLEKSGSSIDRSSESGSMGSGSNEIKVLKSQSHELRSQLEKQQLQPAQQLENQLYQRFKLTEFNKLHLEEIKEKKVPNNFSPAFMTALTKNPVSVLYEFCQPRGMACEFKVIEMEGPPHKPRISTAVFINGKQFETAIAPNKKEGKRKAADVAIRTLISSGYFSETVMQSSLKPGPKDGLIQRKEIITSNKEKCGDRHSKYDEMASLIYNRLAELMDKLSPKESLSLAGRKVVAGIVMQDVKYDHFEVVSLSTGNRCITGDKMSLHGKIVNDSHAEIVARRSFMYFLYKQLDKHISMNSDYLEIFEEVEVPKSFSNKKYFKIKDHIKFHLYISTAPCGDGALFCSKESIEKKYETQIVYSHEHEPIYENNSQGLLRSKIEGGEGTIPVQISEDCNQIQTLDGILLGERLRTMSCSDKIARWNYLGIQGALLEYFMKPIYLKSIMLGNLFHAGHLSRAVCCRLEKFTISPLSGRCDVNHPDLVSVYVGELHREIDKSNELSINWCYGEIPELVDGVTGELSMKVSTHSFMPRISKAVLFNEFHKIYKKLRCPLSISSMIYRDVKSMCREYDDKKKALYLKFFCAKYGSWICKPVEQSQFINCLNV